VLHLLISITVQIFINSVIEHHARRTSKKEVIEMGSKYIEDTDIEYLLDTPQNRQWLKEVAAYDAMWQDLLKTHKGKFVAIHNGEVVDCARDGKVLYHRVCNKYKPVYIQQVLETRHAVLMVDRLP
jgi:hypothetical protein